MSHNTPFLEAFKLSIPVLFGYVPMGMAFGLLLVDQDYAWYWSTIMGLVIFAGAAQFMAIGLLAAQAGMFEVAMTTLLLNSRHVFYGLSLVNHLKVRGIRKLYVIFGLTDETYSLLTAHIASRSADQLPRNMEEARFQFNVTALNQSYWVSGCTLGALIGEAITFNTAGLEFTLPALFMVLVIEQYKATQKLFPFAIAFIAAVISLSLFNPESMLLISISLTLILLLGGRSYFERESANG